MTDSPVKEQLIAAASHEHRAACKNIGDARRNRARRDQYILEIYEGGGFTYKELATKIGCSQELIAKIVQGRTTTTKGEQ